MSRGPIIAHNSILKRRHHYISILEADVRNNKGAIFSKRETIHYIPNRVPSKTGNGTVDTAEMHQLSQTELQQQKIKLFEEFRRGATLKWLDTIVIKQKLCPFAPPVRNEPQLRIKVSHASTHEGIAKEVEREAHILVGEFIGSSESEMKRPDTTLIILNEEKCKSLQDFRDLIHLSWCTQEVAINRHNYTSKLQQVLFHPLAKHETYGETSEVDDPAHYTIRSPFPMIHLLREVDVIKAVTSGYKDLDLLPSQNKKKMRKDGLIVCKRRLEACIQ